MVLGIQNYYSLATNISVDLQRIQYDLNKVIENRLQANKKGKITQCSLTKISKSKQLRYLAGRPIIPIGYIRNRKPINKPVEANIFTSEGTAYLQQNENIFVSELQRYMLSHPIWNESIEYNDNRQSLLSAQHGKDKITGQPLIAQRIHCHHVHPRNKGGTDEYNNLILVDVKTHELIHSISNHVIVDLLLDLNLTERQLKVLNKYRVVAGNKEIEAIS